MKAGEEVAGANFGDDKGVSRFVYQGLLPHVSDMGEGLRAD